MTGSTDVSAEAVRTSRARRLLWAAVLVVIAWFAIGGVVGPLAGKLSSAQKNDAAAFLPASAESTKVNDQVGGFVGDVPFPVTVLFTSPEPITPDQLQAVERWAGGVPSLPLENGDGKTVGDYLTSPPQVVPSQDGLALQVGISIDSNKAATPLSDGKSPLLRITETLRASNNDVAGLTSYVTGAGGILADLIAVFGEIDTKLLGATALVVTVILILVYRSPFLWIVPLTSAGLALSVASAVVYGLAKNGVVSLNGQSQGILTVLVFGAGTDYALLMVSRYREELHRQDSHVEAMRAAWLGVWEPIVASAATASLGLLALLTSELNSNKSTGPIAAIGIVSALGVMLTFLPAVLVVPSLVLLLLMAGTGYVVGALVASPAVGGVLALAAVALFGWGAFLRRRPNPPAWAFWTSVPSGRWAFWPKVPREGESDEKLSGVWSRVARTVGRRPWWVMVGTTVVLVVLAGLSTTLNANGIQTTDSFANKGDVESVQGQAELGKHFPAGEGDFTYVIGPAGDLAQTVQTIQQTEGVASVVPFTGSFGPPPAGSQPQPKVVDGQVLYLVTLDDASSSLAAEDTVVRLRSDLEVVSPEILVGGQAAVNYDTQQASKRDNRVVIPIVLAVILVVLVLLLRSLVAPVLLILTVVLSYLATLGLSAVAFNHWFSFPGADSSFPLFTFVFLVALGIDYNIFLMTRVREESRNLGTRPGILKGLTVTGGVITSAGVVLAATFLVLGVLPLVFLREIGFAVAAGVLLDTLVVRSLLVPSATYLLGPPIWWPSALRRRRDVSGEEQHAASVPYIRESETGDREVVQA